VAIAIDTSVLLDVIIPDPQFGVRSRTAMNWYSDEGFVVCETTVAELAQVLTKGPIEEFLSDWNIAFLPSSLTSAALAGTMFREYRQRGGKREKMIPDFLIGAHASIHSTALLTRDRGYFRDYFSGLTVIDPAGFVTD
jgi:hypothetical protein